MYINLKNQMLGELIINNNNNNNNNINNKKYLFRVLQ